MKKLLTILLLFPIMLNATNYTWSSASTNIVIDDAGVFGNLNAGDTVFIPVRSGGYRSFSINNCNSGTVGGYVVVYWMAGAYNTAGLSQTFSNVLNSSSGVKIVNMTYVDVSDIFRMTGYSNYIWFDNCDFTGSSLGLFYSGSQPNFNGTFANSMHHWQFTYCLWDDHNGVWGGGALLVIGTQNLVRNGYWFDTKILHCNFKHLSCGSNASNFVSIFTSFNTEVAYDTFSNLGMALHPVGHSAVVNLYGSQIWYHDNIGGNDNFGNDLRGKFADCPSMGAAYTGLSRIWNNIAKDKRKYPMFEVQFCDTSGFGGGYARPRNDSTPLFWNNTMYNGSVGAGGNAPYITTLIDDYLNSAVVTAKNNVFVMVRDSTCSPNAWVQGVIAASGTGLLYDTASNKFSCNWVGFNDSIYFYPKSGWILHNAGVAVPSWITTDINGNPRTNGSAPDIGASELTPVVTLNNPRFIRKRFKKL